jgi:hypothetical protein
MVGIRFIVRRAAPDLSHPAIAFKGAGCFSSDLMVTLDAIERVRQQKLYAKGSL